MESIGTVCKLAISQPTEKNQKPSKSGEYGPVSCHLPHGNFFCAEDYCIHGSRARKDKAIRKLVEELVGRDKILTATVVGTQ